MRHRPTHLRAGTLFVAVTAFTVALLGSLEDPVSQYVAGLQGSAYDSIAIRHFLTMTSGVRWNEDYSDPDSDGQLIHVDPDRRLVVAINSAWPEAVSRERGAARSDLLASIVAAVDRETGGDREKEHRSLADSG